MSEIPAAELTQIEKYGSVPQTFYSLGTFTKNSRNDADTQVLNQLSKSARHFKAMYMD
jgi:hypothetical protein